MNCIYKDVYLDEFNNNPSMIQQRSTTTTTTTKGENIRNALISSTSGLSGLANEIGIIVVGSSSSGDRQRCEDDDSKKLDKTTTTKSNTTDNSSRSLNGVPTASKGDDSAVHDDTTTSTENSSNNEPDKKNYYKSLMKSSTDDDNNTRQSLPPQCSNDLGGDDNGIVDVDVDDDTLAYDRMKEQQDICMVSKIKAGREQHHQQHDHSPLTDGSGSCKSRNTAIGALLNAMNSNHHTKTTTASIKQLK